MNSILEVRRLDDLVEFREDWSRLLSCTPGATFFQSLDWLEVYWRHFAGKQDLRVVIVFEAGEPVGIVPLCVRLVSTNVGTCRILTYPIDDWGSFYGPIGERPEETLREALQHLDGRTREWDLVDLRWIRDLVVGADVHLAMTKAGLSPHYYPWEQTALIDLQRSWDDYWKSRSGHCRQSYRRSERQFSKTGGVQYVRYRPRGSNYGEDDPRWDLYDSCVEIARRSWQGSSTSGTTLSHESVRDYLRDTHQAAVRVGAADLNLLLMNGRPAAFVYNYVFGGWVHSLRRGFDASVSDKGLGRLLLCRMIRDSFERGDHMIDMGAGTIDCKRYWLTSVETIGRYVHFVPTSPKARLLKLALKVDGWFTRRFADVRRTTSSPQPSVPC